MHISFIGPTSSGDLSIGQALEQLLGQPFKKVILISAFANAAAIYRLMPSIKEFIAGGGQIRVVLGIDLQSTTQESLQCLLDCCVETFVFKNRRGGCTFHPKVYYFESDTFCTLITGSSNLTGGGAFTNYEANLRLDFDLSDEYDKKVLQSLQNAIKKYLAPPPQLAKRLTSASLQQMVGRSDVLPERLRQGTRGSARGGRRGPPPDALYGMEPMPSMPALPKDIMDFVVKENRKVKAIDSSRAVIPLKVEAFYMTLNKLQGRTIPGEVRIPLAAIRALPDFWEWPNRYSETSRKRGRVRRVYREWKPIWEIIDGKAQVSSFESVRMYLYEASMDFRFYSSRLVELGADEGDLIIIRHLNDQVVVFQCEWIKKNDPRFDALRLLAPQKVRNPKNPTSPRSWGYS
jgi:HKD family nuclease